MLEAKRIQFLPQIPAPALTAYLNTNPGDARNQGHPAGYLTWLKSRARVLARRIAKDEQKLFREQIARLENHLRARPAKSAGVIVFAGPATWELFVLRCPVEDELHWGRPSLTQLLWLLDEHQPYGVAHVDRSGLRSFRVWLGEIAEQPEEEFKVDTTRWRRKDLLPPSHPGVLKTRGSQRDVFQQRIEAQYDRFFREAAARIERWVAKEELNPVFVVGPEEVVDRVWPELPPSLRRRAGRIKAALARMTAPALLERIAPEVERWKREHELEIVERMLGSGKGLRAVTGVDETLERLQRGQARELLVVRGLGGRLRQCVRCEWASRSADPVCATCGGERRTAALRAAIPQLARRYAVPVEVVGGEAGRKLREAGGLAAWLR